MATFTFLNKPSVPIPLLCVLVPLTCPGHLWMEQGVQEAGECRPCPRGARICTQLLPPQQHPQLPSRRGVSPHPVPPRLIPSRLILFHPVPHRTLPTARRDPPKEGNHRHPPGAGGLPAAPAEPTGIPRGASPASPALRRELGARSGRQGRRVPSCCRLSAETRVALPGVSGDRPRHSLLLAVCFICKLLARRGPCGGSGDASRRHRWPWGHPDPCQPPKKPQIPVGCWQ